MIIVPEYEYRKSADWVCVFLKTIYTIPESQRKNGYEFVKPTKIFYSEFNKDTGICDIDITEEEFNTGIPISKEESSALREYLKEKAVA